MAKKLPTGIRADFKVYVRSDTSGSEMVITAEGCGSLPDDVESMVPMAVKAANGCMAETDFRPMTDAEINEYVKQKAAEDEGL